MLYGIIARHDAVEDMLKEAKTQFKWTDSQAQAALKPLLKRNNFEEVLPKIIKKTSKRSTKRK
jgi:hypothetical protein